MVINPRHHWILLSNSQGAWFVDCGGEMLIDAFSHSEMGHGTNLYLSSFY